jgi:hypothetical protein
MDPFALAHDAGALMLAAVWIASALWVYTDALGRFEREDRPRKLFAAALALPLAAPLLYAFVRPAERPAERRASELARRLLEEELAAGERCLACRTPVEPEFLRCPSCAAELRRPCAGCGARLKLHWSACPHCEGAVESTRERLQLVA